MSLRSSLVLAGFMPLLVVACGGTSQTPPGENSAGGTGTATGGNHSGGLAGNGGGEPIRVQGHDE